MSVSSKERREAARAEAERLRELQRRADRRQRAWFITAIVALLVVFVGLIVLILGQGRDADPEAELVVPQGADADTGAVSVGPAGVAGSTEGAAADAVVVTVYTDYLCGYCARFEELNSPVLAELRQSGEVVVDYHVITLYPDQPADVGLAAAAALVVDQAPEAFLDFHHAIYAYQPTVFEAQGAISDAEIAELARQSGVPEPVAVQIESGEYRTGERSFVPWTRHVTQLADAALDRLATPTILIDGEPMDATGFSWLEEGGLESAIRAAQEG